MAVLPVVGGDTGAWGTLLNTWLLVAHNADGTDKGVLSGSGSPEGVVTATVGTLYRRTDGVTGASLYVKENGAGNTGWAAVGSIVDPELLALMGAGSAADRVPYYTGAGAATLAVFTAAGRALLDDADATAQRNTLGLVIGTDVPAVSVSLNTRTASYTLVLADAGKVVEMNVGSANTLTVPPNSSVAFPVGTLIEIDQIGAGQTTIVAGAGVTIRSAGSLLKLAGQYSAGSLRKRATDEWVLVGDLA